jgi:hypothetical protein
MNGDHIQAKISKQDILIYPFISMYILVYIHRRYPYSYPPKLSNVYPCISSFIPVQYPGIISLMISNYDIRLYPNISICIQYIYPYQISLVLSHTVILTYPCYPCSISREISMMISNYDILVTSKYIHDVYPI